MKRLLIQSPLIGEYRFIRQAGFPRFGHVLLSVESSSREGLSFHWDVLPEQIPEMFREAVYRGVSRSFEPGAQFGEYVPDGLSVRVIGGSFQENDSNEGSFEIASMQAFAQALTASPRHLTTTFHTT